MTIELFESIKKERLTDFKLTRKKLVSLLKDAKDNNDELLLTDIYNEIYPHEITEAIVRNKGKNLLGKFSSFKTLIAQRTELRLRGLKCPEWELDDKKNAYNFIDSINVPRPMLISEFNINKMEEFTNGVVKPKYGSNSKGVFIIQDEFVYDVANREFISLEEAKKRMLEINMNPWLHETAVVSQSQSNDDIPFKPPHDLKFYSFYGEIALILEVRRYPDKKYCWWDVNGEVVSTGKYNTDLFDGNGFTKEDLEIAKHVSKNIKSPFCRVDFLKTKEDFIFGEFTPRPGGFDEFDSETDRMLGDYFIDALIRINNE
ncbi:ATP-grasp fold amidoligase family protein [Vibrio metschnikovii]|uniref:ATP-grasp fold amidoligase family protein n=1 Tax=Vibrio metschnikovii TaxID=28172 RepID=UPI001C2F1EA5|nr:ATP-grasp fold amidoligase family protein [Vibrio metschnikovii]